jgi:arsenite methyltransferase
VLLNRQANYEYSIERRIWTYIMSNSLEANTHAEVQRYYGETLESSADLKTTACCTADAVPDFIKPMLADIHDEVLQRYYGCGLVLPEALAGLRVLDLGCGAGRDVYLLARLVGPTGAVVGVDMTPEQLDVARRHQGYHADTYGYAESNVEFLEANIERLDDTDLQDSSFDLIVSNCVINLAVDKAAVLRSAQRLLKPGGEMYFSDIYADRRIPSALANDPVLYGECLSGAMYWSDFQQTARACGFADPRLLTTGPVDVTDPALREKVGSIGFESATFRLFNIPELEMGQEDYGQVAVYKGTISQHPEEFRLDQHFAFKSGEKTPISGNLALILRQTRLQDHFDILGDDRDHLGEFSVTPVADAPSGGPESSCC